MFLTVSTHSECKLLLCFKGHDLPFATSLFLSLILLLLLLVEHLLCTRRRAGMVTLKGHSPGSGRFCNSLVSFIPDLSHFHMSVEHEPVAVHLRPTLHSTCYCVLSNFLYYLSNSYDNLARGWRPRWAHSQHKAWVSPVSGANGTQARQRGKVCSCGVCLGSFVSWASGADAEGALSSRWYVILLENALWAGLPVWLPCSVPGPVLRTPQCSCLPPPSQSPAPNAPPSSGKDFREVCASEPSGVCAELILDFGGPLLGLQGRNQAIRKLQT